MKKILLSIGLLVAIGNLYSQQVVLNEIYPDPSTGNSEYIELYNTTGEAINLDCYSIISYYKENGGGAWVLNLPDVEIEPFGHIVFASSYPILRKVGGSISTYPSVSNPYPAYGPNLYNWNSIDPVTGLGTTGYLRNYTRSGNNLLFNSLATTTNDFIPISNGNSAAVAIMLWNGNDLSNALFTNSDVPQGSSQVLSLNPLNLNFLENELDGNDCAPSGDLVFSTIGAPEVEVAAINSAPGSDNGYARLRDGFCSQWAKVTTTFTPGFPNSNEPPIDASASVSIAALAQQCGELNEGANTGWNISVAISELGLLPGTYRIYGDDNHSQSLNFGDALITQGAIPTTATILLPNTAIKTGSAAIVQVITASGCIVVTKVHLTECTPLPVKLKSFTASRKQTNVELKWTTTLEQNNSGFELQRQSGAGGWQKIGFVHSKATGGNSVSDLHYSYTDVNDSRGVSQYRLMQVDLDDNAKYSEIRSVQGIGQEARTIISPNPTANGRVNVTFKSANSKKDLQLTDMHGRMLKQWNAYSDNSLQISDLTPGIYQLRIVDRETGTQTVEKIMVVNR